ncbi:MAG: methyltransferase domain-containing protein [Pseudomonadota bacterium]
MHEHEEARYWNEEGGERWVQYIDQLERMLEPLTGRLFEALAVKAGEVVLDIGCGGGPTTEKLARQVGPEGRALGVDISAKILSMAEQRFGDIAQLEFLRADAGTHHFDSQFDLISSRFGVMFFPEPEKAFANLAAAAKSTGRLIFLCWQPLDQNPWMLAPAQAAFEHVEPPAKPAPGAPGPFSLASVERTESLLSSVGFGDIQIEPVTTEMNLGAPDQALDLLTKVGPAAAPLREANSQQREAALQAMRAVLDDASDAGEVRFPGAAWLVSATIN